MSSGVTSASPGDEEMLRQVLATGEGDPAGRETFGRYRYQVRLAVRYWLQTLTPDGPTRVLVEQNEDLVLVYPAKTRFCQVKSREPGRSRWSFSVIAKPGGGLDSLARAFKATRQVDGSYELFLEGHASRTQPTRDFFVDPSGASDECVAQLRDSLELNDAEMQAFLASLHVVPGQPTRSSIDKENIFIILRLIPSCTLAVAEETYLQLLQEAESAQEGTPYSNEEHLLELLSESENHVLKTLTKARLLEMLPSTPQLPRDWESLVKDSEMSDLERKLRLAGASDVTIGHAISLRALADLRIRTAKAGPRSENEYVEQVAASTLMFAEAVAAPHKTSARAGDEVFSKLVMGADALKAADPKALFAAPFELVGVVCQISDECRFPWRMP